MKSTSLPFTRKTRRILPTALPARLAALGLLTLALAACGSPAASTPTATASVTEAPPTATFTPEPTATPTEIPLLEVTLEQLSQMDSSLGSFTQDDEGGLLYSSPLQSAVGKNVEFIQEERVVGLGGGPETHFSPAEHPNAPAVVYDKLTGEFRRGPFGYIEIKKDDYPFIEREEYGRGTATLDFLIGRRIPNNFVELIEKDNATMYAVSVFPQEEMSFENKNGYFSLLVATPIGDKGDNYSIFYDVIFSPYEKDSMYSFYMSLYQNSFEYGYAITEENMDRLRGNDEEYRKLANDVFRTMLRVGSQSLIYGMRAADSREDIPREGVGTDNNRYLSQYRLAYANSEAMDILFDILAFATLPGDLDNVTESLKMFGVAEWYYDDTLIRP